MLLSVLAHEADTDLLERHYGFRGIRALGGDGGQERFGVIDLAGGGHAAVLPIVAGAGAGAGSRSALVGRLAAALPECAVQFVLSRRPQAPARLAGAWQAGAPAPAAAVWHDLQSSAARLTSAGLADLWTGVAVAAVDLDELTGRVAGLFAGLPGVGAPLAAGALRALVRRLGQPDLPAPVPGAETSPAEGSAPLALPAVLVGAGAVARGDDTVTAFWQITPPLPAGGWLARLLEFPDLLPYALDLAIHVRPAREEETMRAVLDGRLAHLRTQLAGGADAESGERRLLELEQEEVHERRARLSQGADRLREVDILLAAHLPAGDAAGRAPAAPAADALSRALAAAAIPAQPLRGRARLGRAVRATLPLVAASDARRFVVPARQAADLVTLPAPMPAPPGGLLLGLTRDRQACLLAPGAGCIVAGGGAAARRAAARQWALLAVAGGARLRLWDPAGAWTDWVAALGGRVVRPGGPAPADRLNLLAAPLAALDQPEFFHGWVRETAGLLAGLLAPPAGLDAETARSQVSAALLQVVLRALEQRDPAALGLDALQAELQAGGYRAAAAALAQLAGGPADALFAADAPPLDTAPIVALGPPHGLPPALGRLAAQIALRRLLLAPDAPERTVVLLDTLAPAWGHPPLITDLLALAAARGGGADLWLLPAAGEAAALLERRAGRALMRGLRCQVLFGPAAGDPPAAPLPGGDADVAALLALAGVPPAAAAPLALLPPDQALIVTPGRSDAVEIVLGDLARHA